MKAAIILSLAGSSLAVPFANAIDAMFGTNLEARQHHHRPGHNFPGHHNNTRPTGSFLSGFPSGVPVPTGVFAAGFPSGWPSGVPAPTGGFPSGSPGHHHGHRPHRSRSLAINYQLAPTAAPALNKRQTSDLPGFSLLDPTDPTPSSLASNLPSDESSAAFPIPTGGPAFPFPTGAPFPTGGFPTRPTGTGIPFRPTTLATLTRGPRPTGAPGRPGLPPSDDGANDDGQAFWDWLGELFGIGKGKGKEE